jgi:hypothetical protein
VYFKVAESLPNAVGCSRLSKFVEIEGFEPNKPVVFGEAESAGRAAGTGRVVSIPSVLKQGCRMAQLALSIIIRGLNM